MRYWGVIGPVIHCRRPAPHADAGYNHPDALWELLELCSPALSAAFAARVASDWTTVPCSTASRTCHTRHRLGGPGQQLGYSWASPAGGGCRDWNDGGVFDQLHQLVLARLHAADQLNWSRAVIDGSHRALKGDKTGTGPLDRTGRQQATTWATTSTASRSRSR